MTEKKITKKQKIIWWCMIITIGAIAVYMSNINFMATYGTIIILGFVCCHAEKKKIFGDDENVVYFN